jgi:hypothetical protein
MPIASPVTVSNYYLDWSPWLDDAETIVTSTWTVPDGLTETQASSVTGNVTTVWLTGGVIGEQYVVENTIESSSGRSETWSIVLTIVDLAAGEPDPYCTLTEARNAGAVGDDEQVAGAIQAAMARVDTFTSQRFSPREMTVVAQVQPDGRAFLPYRVTSPTSIDTVEDVDTATTYAAEVWRAYSSATPGDVDSIGVGVGYVGSNILVNGLEPWNRTMRATGRVRVTGQFGWAVTPPAVRWATAHLAGIITRAVRPDDDGDPLTPTPETAVTADPEGNVLPVVPPFTDDDLVDYDPVTAGRTTGSRKADAALMPYRNDPVLLGV